MEKIIFDPKWIPLVEIIEKAPAVSGIYMLAFDKPIKYDKGVSRIIYIGSSINLRKRLQQHNKDPNVYLFQNIQDPKENLYAFFYPFFEVRDQKEVLEIEQDAFSSFINKFGVYPICNWQPPTGYLGSISINSNIKYEYFKIHICHVEDQSNIRALTYDDIAKKYDITYEQSYDRVQFRTRWFPEEAKKGKHDRYIKSLSNIFWDNIPDS